MSLFDKLMEIKDELLSSWLVKIAIIDCTIDGQQSISRDESVVEMWFTRTNVEVNTRYGIHTEFTINGFLMSVDKDLNVRYNMRKNNKAELRSRVELFYISQQSPQIIAEIINSSSSMCNTICTKLKTRNNAT